MPKSSDGGSLSRDDICAPIPPPTPPPKSRLSPIPVFPPPMLLKSRGALASPPRRSLGTTGAAPPGALESARGELHGASEPSPPAPPAPRSVAFCCREESSPARTCWPSGPVVGDEPRPCWRPESFDTPKKSASVGTSPPPKVSLVLSSMNSCRVRGVCNESGVSQGTRVRGGNVKYKHMKHESGGMHRVECIGRQI